MKSLLPALLILFFINFSCKKTDKTVVPNEPNWQNNEPAPPDALFKFLPAEQTGVHFQNQINEDFQTNVILNQYLYNGGGVAVLDLNRDGLQDLFFTATHGRCGLFLNKGNLKFEDITDAAKVAATAGHKTGVAVADVNGDGWQDLYVCRDGLETNDLRRNLLFINNQNNTFYEAAKEWGVDDISATSAANFFDYDLDGDLDLYVLVHPTDYATANNMMLKQTPEGGVTRQPLPSKPLDSDRLYRNDGSKFTDVTEAAGIKNRAFGLSTNIRDLDDDGYPDIYVGNDFIEPDFVYINNRNGTFTDRSDEWLRHMANHTMGVDIADLTNDGLPEIISLDMLPEPQFLQHQRATTMQEKRYNTLVANGFGHQTMRNVLQLNFGNGQFGDIACLAGVFATDWAWAPLAQDFDLDGQRDIFINNGYFHDVTNNDYVEHTVAEISKMPGGLSPKNFPQITQMLELIPSFKMKDYFFKNRGDLTFENVSTKWGVDKKNFGSGAAYADLDNDGDLDLVVNNLFEKVFIYKNTAADQKLGNWIQIQVEGSPKNPQGYGAKIRVTAADGQVFTDEIAPMRGYISACQPVVNFGLGKISNLDRLEVEFPEGKRVVMTQPYINQRVTVQFSSARLGRLSPLPQPKPIFRETTGSRNLKFRHVEDVFNDFDREFLLPWKLSIPGPPMAVADVDGNGLDDVFVGGAANQAGALFLQNSGGSFALSSAATFELSKAYEDAGALFFDADADGDPDLLVASGGNAASAGNPLYQPRFYQNDGKGNFTRVGDALPTINESAAALATADLDSDGDLDLLLGGYCLPGRYPAAPKSFILKNEKGRFLDATATFSTDWQSLGMVRAIEAADLDGDKIVEIIVASEWQPIRVFKNSGGKLTDATANFFPKSLSGIWRSLLAADFDSDGDLDLVAGNLGLNTRLRASDSDPLTLYASDFDGNGSIEPLVCQHEFGQEKPLALRPLVLKQLPILKKKFVKNLDYAMATVEDFFPREVLEKDIHLKVNELATIFFENKNGRFEARRLPNLAQIAPATSMIAHDANSDGKLDLILVGNDYGQQVETGRIDSGNGCVLLNDGAGWFRPMWPRESGFWARFDARSLRRVKTAGGRSLFLVGNSGGALQVFE